MSARAAARLAPAQVLHLRLRDHGLQGSQHHICASGEHQRQSLYLLRVMMMIFVNIYFIFYPADLCTALHPMMKILVLVKQREWRTVLQPLVATEEDSWRFR